jgi:hypothetical protein
MGCGSSLQKEISLPLPKEVDAKSTVDAAATQQAAEKKIEDPVVEFGAGEDSDTTKKKTENIVNIPEAAPTLNIAANTKAEVAGKAKTVVKPEENQQGANKQTSLDEQISKLYNEILDGEEDPDSVGWEIMQRKGALLSNGLLALGIGQNAEEFIKNSFKDLKPNTASLAVFTQKLKEEWDVSRKLVWLSQTDVLRQIAKGLPRAEESDPLSGLRNLKEEDVHKLTEGMISDIAGCLYRHIEIIPVASAAGPSDAQGNNSKFCVDPTLFTLKYVLFSHRPPPTPPHPSLTTFSPAMSFNISIGKLAFSSNHLSFRNRASSDL